MTKTFCTGTSMKTEDCGQVGAPYMQHHIIHAVGASVHPAFKFAEFIQTVMPAQVFMPEILLAGTKTGYRQL
jgi:hypothetical protein